MGKTRATPIPTPRAYGAEIVKKARNWEKYHVFQEREGAEAALDDTVVGALAACTNEHQLVAKLTPHLERIFKNDGVHVVNSEEYSWLRTSEDRRFNQKPDMMLCDEAIYTKLSPWNSGELSLDRRGSDKFGRLSDWVLRDCLAATFEAKTSIGNSGIGETTNYGNHITFGQNAPPFAKLVLFDKTSFYLLEVSSGENVTIQECGWTTPGSKELLRSFPFFQSPWVKLRKAACERWGVTIARDSDGSAWLGHGTFGRVFRVKRSDSDKHMALKLVLPSNAANLSLEMSTMVAAASSCDCVMPIAGEQMKVSGESQISCDFGDLGGAMLLLHVGDPVDRAKYGEVIHLLASLHQKNIYHGDPRLANVVQFGDKMFWIDFFIGKHLTSLPPETKQSDMSTLVSSILDVTDLPTGIGATIKSYSGDDTTTKAVIDAVQGELSSRDSST